MKGRPLSKPVQTPDLADSPPARRGRRRRVRHVLLAAVFLIVAVYLAAHRKPSWYRPVHVALEDIPAVEASVANVLDAIGDSIVLQQPFDVVLHERQINEWLGAAPELAKKWNRAWPAEVRASSVALDDGFARVGSHVRYGGWQAIVGMRVTPTLSADGATLALTLTGATVGAIPCPSAAWTSFVDPRLDKLAQGRTGEAGEASGRPFQMQVDRSQRGVRTITLPNDFLWPNGRRRFRIGSISIGRDGTMRLTVAPM